MNDIDLNLILEALIKSDYERIDCDRCCNDAECMECGNGYNGEIDIIHEDNCPFVLRKKAIQIIKNHLETAGIK